MVSRAERSPPLFADLIAPRQPWDQGVFADRATVWILRVAVALLLAVAVVAAPRVVSEPPAPALVRLGGRLVFVPPSRHLGDLLDREGSHPKPGRLLSILGHVLGPDGGPPSILVNGAPAALDSILNAGDRVAVQDGVDRTEAVDTTLFDQAGGNPQFLLGGGTVTLLTGKVSKEVEPVVSSGSGPPSIALTFDDGPDPRNTPGILDILERSGVKATFFDVGAQAERHADLVRRELADGMVVGNHTWSHARLTRRSASGVLDQLKRAQAELGDLGATSGLFRPPYGSFSPSIVAAASSLGLRTVMWSIDPRDWARPGADGIVERVISAVRPGSIILLHDGGGDRSQTVEALAKLVDVLKARGYSFVTL